MVAIMTLPSPSDSLPTSPRQSPVCGEDPPYLATLNPPQRAAVETVEGPVLVLAGAGTGKTRVLTTRLAHTLLTGRAWPSQILAVTFTNKAAREMRERLERMIGPSTEGLWLGTFHALAARLLRRHAEMVGLRPDFTILDTDDQIRLIKQVAAAEGVDEKRWPARTILQAIERWKDRGLTPGQVTGGDGADSAGGRGVLLYRLYQDRLRILNAADFGDLMLHTLTIFRNHPAVLADYQRKFRYILVDEYQDTNVAQYLWLRLLAQAHHNICCVGDDDQSIYGWRGAEVGNILRFEADFPGAVVIRLEQNYRSTPQILSAAAHLIAHNSGRLGKTLWTEAAAGEKVSLRGLWDGEAEARSVGEEIEAAQRRGVALSQIAILVRAGFQTREFEDRFLTIGLAYRVVGGVRFYERQEIRDALAYLRLVAQPDDDLAFERIVNLPRRGIGGTTVQLLHETARAGGISLVAAARHLLNTKGLKAAAQKAVGLFIRDLDRWRGERDRVPHPQLAEIILDESGYTALWQADKSPEAPGRLENLRELTVAMAEFETLAGFLEHVSLVMDVARNETRDQVSLMTLHAAKGLEFDLVFLPGWEEGLFPHQRALDESGTSGLEEERRLAYVGLTRARKHAFISYAANRRIHGQWQSALPSRFVEELPQGELDVTVERGLYAGGGGAGRFGGWAGSEQTGGHGFGGGGSSWQHTPTWAAPQTPPSRLLAPNPASSPSFGHAKAGYAAKSGGFRSGDTVRHGKFGIGIVRLVEDNKLTVVFETAGEKKLMDSFVEKVG